jgi:hypothetical protein
MPMSCLSAGGQPDKDHSPIKGIVIQENPNIQAGCPVIFFRLLLFEVNYLKNLV